MIDLEFASDPAMLPQVREKVRAWAEQRGWTDHQVGEIALAVDEALSNVIRHGYQGRDNERICLHMAETYADDVGEGVEIVVRDFCSEVDLDAICGRQLDDVRPGGLGVHLIRAMMEEVRYSHAEGGGLLLRMWKSKRHRAQSANGTDKEST